LQGKDLNIEKGSIPVLDNYIGQEFTFVVSWITNSDPVGIFEKTQPGDNFRRVPPNYPSQQTSRQKGIFVTFPTRKIYYPLLPTSVYESEVVPATIRVMGFTNPEVFQDIKPYTETEYYIQRNLTVSPLITNFYNGATRNVKYTKIEINAPSKMLTDDLWISSVAPFKALYASFIAQHEIATSIILLILVSVITAILVGMVIFRETRNKKGLIRLGTVGLFNALSIIGLMIAILFTRIREVKEDEKKLLENLKQKGYSVWAIQKRDLRKIVFIFLFSGVFLVIAWGVVKLIESSL